ncbi:ABC transporter substrate-binding protein [Herbiconiux sp. A18JL235]|uniref:ABC transporter substrate-binding protein n=1 Tax=Herbiconiux sp. A18JL235 TaxID=3152363 RepID=A0AB39BFE3_9MICO
MTREALIRRSRRPADGSATTLASAAVALLALMLAGCVGDAGAVEDETTPAPVATMGQPIPTGDGVLTIGALVPLTGADAPVGAAALAGMELAARDIHSAGGVPGTRIVIIHADTAAPGALAGLAARGADVVVGALSDDALAAAGDEGSAAGVAVLGLHPGTEIGDAEFEERLRGSDPGLVSTASGLEGYDAVMLIALAALASGDDGAVSIARFLPEVAAGETTCASFGACSDALRSRLSVRYTGALGTLPATAPVSLGAGG